MKPAASLMLRVLVVLVAWCALMLAYLKTYDLIEQSAVPVMLARKDFSIYDWDKGSFRAKGSFENQSVITPGDQLPLQTNIVTCDKTANTCTISSADVLDRYLDVDVTAYEISSWTNQEITFADDTPICVTNSYVINRAAETMTLIVRKRAAIPDYAASSPLHPCDNTKDENIDLADGFKVYWAAKTDFEARNGLYLHSALAAINVFFLGVLWLWSRRRSSVKNVASEL